MPINTVETPIIAVVTYALWTAFLAFIVPIWRMVLISTGQARPHDFTPGDAHGSPTYWRLNRAHANCVENLVVFSALAVCGLAAGISDILFGQLCFVVLGARIVQSLLHVASGASAVVAIRFAAYLLQVVCFAGIGSLILQRMF